MEPVIVTPSLAMRWTLRQELHHHCGQHRIINRYATLMRGGYWHCDGHDPVRFNDAGVLVDGRCRVAAVILSQMPVQLYVIGGNFGPWAPAEPAIA